MYIAVDFDGTCVEHEFPDVGADVPGAVRWMKEWVAAGAKLILWTMRSRGPSDRTDVLKDAVRWFEVREIPLFGVNHNPTQSRWTQSQKAYAHLYVDDAAYGCPLRESAKVGGRPMVDWDVVGPAVLDRLMQFATPRETAQK
jgi:hypothetical protein